MTIKKGQEWGEPVTRPHGLAVVKSDAELAAVDPDDCPVGLTGGDVFRSVGSPPPRQDAVCLAIDRLLVSFDHDTAVAVAHVVARRPGLWSWWHGPLVAVCNTDFVGQWNVAPRAHPNDGRFDVVEVTSMPIRQRWAARRRLRHGTHVPHPAIAVRAGTDASWDFAKPMTLWIDGVDRGACSQLSVSIEPDALSVIV